VDSAVGRAAALSLPCFTSVSLQLLHQTRTHFDKEHRMPPQLSTWLNAVTAIALVVAVGAIVKDKTGSPPAATAVVRDDARPRLLELERELQAIRALPRSGESDRSDLEQRVEALKHELAVLAKASTSAAEPGTVIPLDPIDPIDQERLDHEHDQQTIASLEQSLVSEVADSSGTLITQAEISRMVQTAALENTILNGVQCAKTLCRIDVSLERPDAAMQFNVALNQLEAFRDSEGFVQQLPRSDGGVDIVTYVSRGNHRLPLPQES
jgi:hypothetical protein